MGTTLYETDKAKLFRYFGGIERGPQYIIKLEGSLEEVNKELDKIKIEILLEQSANEIHKEIEKDLKNEKKNL